MRPMQSAAAELLEDPVELHAEVLRLRDCVAESERQIQQLLDYITLLKRKRFGPSADRISPDQLKLFDEAELEALIAELEIAIEPPATTTPSSRIPEMIAGPAMFSGK